MAKDATKRVMLTHFCRKAGCEGNPGDVINVTAEDLKFIEDRNGGYEVDEDGKWIDKSPKEEAAK